MDNNFLETIELVKEQKAHEAQLSSLLWGTVEVRERQGRKYIYLHKRIDGVARTVYVSEYSEELFSQIQYNNVKIKEIKRRLRSINKLLKDRKYTVDDLTDAVRLNIDFAKRNLVDTIYKQAVLEGVAVTFLDTETIVEGGKINGVSADDIQKINNLKHAWQFVLEEGVITSKSDYQILCLINRLVEEGFYYNAGKLRNVPVYIGGTKWKPELPIESVFIEQLRDILQEPDVYERAIDALLFVTRRQLFIDGNKRTSVIFANHILISNGAGLIVIPEEMVSEYKKLLIVYYETNQPEEIKQFLYNKCLTKFKYVKQN
ncbi:MAG: Fic family protein [Clostridia bacterium]|nr:Fic family protein [Clostridia bacterium]